MSQSKILACIAMAAVAVLVSVNAMPVSQNSGVVSQSRAVSQNGAAVAMSNVGQGSEVPAASFDLGQLTPAPAAAAPAASAAPAPPAPASPKHNVFAKKRAEKALQNLKATEAAPTHSAEECEAYERAKEEYKKMPLADLSPRPDEKKKTEECGELSEAFEEGHALFEEFAQELFDLLSGSGEESRLDLVLSVIIKNNKIQNLRAKHPELDAEFIVMLDEDPRLAEYQDFEKLVDALWTKLSEAHKQEDHDENAPSASSEASEHSAMIQALENIEEQVSVLPELSQNVETLLHAVEQ